MRLRPSLGLLAALALLAACQKNEVEAPTNKGVCYHMVHNKAGGYDFNVVQVNTPAIEYCAAALERLRIKFVALGGSHTEIAGAYHGQFIFVQHEGVFISQTLNGGSYLALMRSGDGRLVVPGAVRTSP
jgi:hypothetical protein